jgi:hypothetical protein
MYISSAQGSVTADQCAAIAGLLLFNSKRFIQVLEGPRAAVESVYERIRQDDRHRGVVKLREAAIDSREFGDWGMAYDDPAQPSANLKDKVAVLLDRAGASTRAHFMGSAEMHRG